MKGQVNISYGNKLHCLETLLHVSEPYGYFNFWDFLFLPLFTKELEDSKICRAILSYWRYNIDKTLSLQWWLVIFHILKTRETNHRIWLVNNKTAVECILKISGIVKPQGKHWQRPREKNNSIYRCFFPYLYRYIWRILSRNKDNTYRTAFNAKSIPEHL